MLSLPASAPAKMRALVRSPVMRNVPIPPETAQVSLKTEPIVTLVILPPPCVSTSAPSVPLIFKLTIDGALIDPASQLVALKVVIGADDENATLPTLPSESAVGAVPPSVK